MPAHDKKEPMTHPEVIKHSAMQKRAGGPVTDSDGGFRLHVQAAVSALMESRCAVGGSVVTATCLAAGLHELGWDAEVTMPPPRGTTRWGSTAPYVTVSGRAFGQPDLIVEPFMKQYLTPANASGSYTDLVSYLVPGPFVGTHDQLETVVTRLAPAIAADFAERGQSVPPWRRLCNMLCRWTKTS